MPRRAGGEGSIGKRADGSYYGAIRLDGKRHWAYGETRKEVSSKLKALQQKQEQGVAIGADKVTVAAFMERWLEEVVKLKNKYSTYRSYRHVTHNHIIPAVGSRTLAALRPDHIQALVNGLVAANKAPRTVRNVRAVLRKALNQAIRWHYVTFNAAALVEIPRIEQHKIQPFTKEEARTFLAAIKGHRLEPLYLLAVYLGLRQGELLGLLLESVDLQAGTVKIDGALQWRPGTFVRDTTKTKSSIRTLPLPASVVPLLKAHIEHQRARFPKSPYLFTSERGGPLSPFTLGPQFKALLKQAGLPAIRFHNLRHTTATLLIARKETPRTVADLLGHSQVSTTLNIYAHSFEAARSEAINGLDKYLAEEEQ